jgi:hypothetical protein
MEPIRPHDDEKTRICGKIGLNGNNLITGW